MITRGVSLNARATKSTTTKIERAARVGSSRLKDARKYATSTKPARAAAAAATEASSPVDAYPFPPRSAEPFPLLGSSLHPLYQRQAPVILPSPLPDHTTSSTNEKYFTSAPIQSKLAVIDACLHMALDVPRASRVFEDMRKDARDFPRSVFGVNIYNKMLEGYLSMVSKDTNQTSAWMEKLWNLYDDMLNPENRDVRPDSVTLEIALRAQMRHPQGCEEAGKPLKELLDDISAREVSVEQIITRDGDLEPAESADLVAWLAQVTKAKQYRRLEREALALKPELNTEMSDSQHPLPEVRPTTKPAKAAGASEGEVVPWNIDTLRKDLQQLSKLRSDMTPMERQREMERRAKETAEERFRRDAEHLRSLEIHTGLKIPSIQGWMWDWYVKLKVRLEEDIKALELEEGNVKKLRYQSSKEGTEPGISPFLRCIPIDTLAMMTILEVMGLHNSGGIDMGIKTARALVGIGRVIESEYQTRLLRRHRIPVENVLRAKGTTSSNVLQTLIARRKAVEAASAKYKKQASSILSWTASIRLRVGGFCMNALMDVATVTRATTLDDGTQYTEEQPAFSHGYDYMRGFKIGIIRLNDAVLEQLSRDNVHTLAQPQQLPMLIEPIPWSQAETGGYLDRRTNLMRIKESEEQELYLKEAGEQGRLESVYDSLNVLSRTGWVVNKKVFEVALNIWNTGEALADIPPVTERIQDPVKPADYETNLKAKSDYSFALRHAAHRRRNNHSERCSTNYKMEIARAFLGETFYMPHNLDFRGRAYPIPPHLSHIGDDLSRGLLKFAQTRPLGVRGLRWLKIHLANVFGNDKISLDAREQFAMDHLDDVYDSAKNPLSGARWWMKADDPWQCLATCMELHAALESPDPLAFESNLPVHQDGTCNGLQHYAALGGDAVGAAQVNLDVGDRPSDVYSYVARMVEDEILRDIEAGDEDLKIVSGKVARKVVKQTVMTTVYGVTMIGARAQIERQLKDRDDIPREASWKLANYLARKVLGCIGDLFQGANGIQTWLSSSAKIIARSIPPERVEVCLQAEPEQPAKGKTADAETTNSKTSTSTISGGEVHERAKAEQMTTVIWTSPLGLPVVQPYRAIKRRQVMTSIQTVYISEPSRPTTVNPGKQASAFPPNFIHSIDATHMMLASLEMARNDLTFASVHDSYWTHASSVDAMSVIIRDTFVQLHSQPILQNLRDEFLERFGNHRVNVNSLTLEDVENVLLNPDVPWEKKEYLVNATGRCRELWAKMNNADTTGDTHFIPRVKDIKPWSWVKSNSVKVQQQSEMGESDASSLIADPQAKHFIDVATLLPPLPRRGNFDVSRTKKSLYFFS